MPEPSGVTAADILAARDVRERHGFLTVDEVTERYGIPLDVIERGVEAEQLPLIAFNMTDGTAASFVPVGLTSAAEWLEAQR